MRKPLSALESPPQPLSLDHQGVSIRFDAGLVEKAVLLAIERCKIDERRSFRAARDPLYETEHAERREESFRALHAEWFGRLGLAETLVALLAEQPSIARSIAACLVVPAFRGKDEHADLRESDGRPTLVIQLCPETLVDPERLDHLLRRELYHVADMLDPAFGYDPDVAVEQTSGPLASILRERHTMLWRVVVDGRLAAAGRLSKPELERLRSRFRSAFPMLEETWEDVFRCLLEDPRPSHPELIELARYPAGRAAGSSGECPLCHMPVPRDQLDCEAPSEAAILGGTTGLP